MSTLQSQRVADLLDKLFADAEKNDPPRLARVRSEIGRHNVNMPDEDRRKLMQLMRDVYIPVAPEVGRLLYLLARMRGARTIVEFGTSLGISAIHLAAAVRDNGSGRIIATELDESKVQRARQNLSHAELDDLVEIRVGDAFETLRDEPDAIDFVLLDGWKEAYLPMLKMLEPRLTPTSIVVADDLKIAPETLAPYLAYMRDPANGYVSVELPLGDGIEISVRVGGVSLRAPKTPAT
jgi:predicted O-methyltransferase YrrM